MQPQLLITKAGKNVQRSGGMRLLLAWIAEHVISWFGSDGFASLPSGFVIILPNPQILHSVSSKNSNGCFVGEADGAGVGAGEED